MSKPLPNKSLPWPIVWAGVVEIAQSEACRLTSYRDIVGVWTIGWGQTSGIGPGMLWTQDQADQDLCRSLSTLSRSVQKLLRVPASGNELAAMVSLAYNIGLAGFTRSSVLSAHNRGDRAAAARAFALWNRAGGKVINGLVARRAREAALYLTPPDYAQLYQARDEVAPATPDADPERALSESSLIRSGAVSAATGGLAMASSVSNDIQQTAWNLGVNPLLVVGTIAVVVGGIVIWQRVKQRREGRA